MSFELFVALRYLLARRKQAFISLISAISALGVAVGVMALVIALALTTGLQGELRDRILGATPHVSVFKVGQGGLADPRAEAERLRTIPGVVGAGPATYGKALISSVHSDAFITLKGVDPELGGLDGLAKAMRSGDAATMGTNGQDRPPGILIGVDLARTLQVFAGDEVFVMTPAGTGSPMGMLYPRRRVRVTGTFSLGLYEFDSSFGFLTLDAANRLLGKPYADIMELRLADIYDAPQAATAVESTLGKDYVAQAWTELNRSLFSALWLEKMAISITIGLIVMVAALNIVASLILLVMEKHSDIGILKTMGASPRSIMWIFVLQGGIIGVLGTTVGAIGGVALSLVMDRYKLIQLPLDVYQVSYVPFVIERRDFMLVAVGAVVICFLATIYPSRRAARLDPVQALRYQ